MKNKKIKPIVIIEKEEPKSNLENIFTEFDAKTQNRPYGIDVIQEINKILEEESTSPFPNGIDVVQQLGERFSEELIKQNPIDWKGFINGDYDNSKEKLITPVKIAAQVIGLDLVANKSPDMKQEDYDLLMEKYDRNYQFINEPYTYKDSTEYKTSDKPINVIKGSWKEPLNKEDISMEIQFEYTPQDDSNIHEDYKELIANMWKAKHRNEIICKEIDTKYDLLTKE